MKPLRRKSRAASEERALQLLDETPEVTLCSQDAGGQPLVRVLNGVRLDDWVVFHGSAKGEKVEALGRSAIVTAYRTVTDVPSHFFGGERACPATTFYESVQVRGTLAEWTNPQDKARALQALMRKLQPEGRHLDLVEHFPVYDKELSGLLVFGVKIESVAGKASVGRDRPIEQVHAVVRGLFSRGRQGDLRAIEEIFALSGKARPAWLRHECGELNQGWDLLVHPGEQEIDAHARLLEGTYWHAGSDHPRRASAIAGSSAWVGARNSEGTLVGAARAVGDGHWTAMILDVVVAPEARGRGLGQALVGLLLGHPRVRDCTYQRLGTQDAVVFYERFGFRPAPDWPRRFESVPMLRVQSGA